MSDSTATNSDSGAYGGSTDTWTLSVADDLIVAEVTRDSDGDSATYDLNLSASLSVTRSHRH